MLGERALQASWQVARVARFDEPLFATGEGATHLEALCQSLRRVSGVLLSQIFGQMKQVIWGEFSADDDGGGTPWVILRAIDSSWCEVETDEDEEDNSGSPPEGYEPNITSIYKVL